MLSIASRKVIRIVIGPPEQIDGPPSGSRRVAIDSPNMIRLILSTLDLEVSDREAIQGCKVPPGFRLWFVTPQETIEADVTLTGHKHLVIKWGSEGGTVHYELPAAFEKLISPYLMQTLES